MYFIITDYCILTILPKRGLGTNNAIVKHINGGMYRLL